MLTYAGPDIKIKDLDLDKKIEGLACMTLTGHECRDVTGGA